MIARESRIVLYNYKGVRAYEERDGYFQGRTCTLDDVCETLLLHSNYFLLAWYQKNKSDGRGRIPIETSWLLAPIRANHRWGTGKTVCVSYTVHSYHDLDGKFLRYQLDKVMRNGGDTRIRNAGKTIKGNSMASSLKNCVFFKDFQTADVSRQSIISFKPHTRPYSHIRMED